MSLAAVLEGFGFAWVLLNFGLMFGWGVARVQFGFCWFGGGFGKCLAKVWLGFCCGFAGRMLWAWFEFGWVFALVLLGRVAASDQGGAGPHPCNLVWF